MGLLEFGARLLGRAARSRQRLKPRAALDHTWWTAANRAVDAPDAETIARLRAAAAVVTDPDESERVEEWLDGLDRLLALAAAPLPIVATQHRVIGSDHCHFAVPASLGGQPDVPGKLFVTSARLVFAGPRVQAWPWHRVRGVLRQERTLSVVLAGGDGPSIMCNSYGDAMVVAHLSRRLTS